ncbi:MAG TPA: transposase, partial [Anaerolineae bacterium]|nr:transposase [Anaerolineae bacterium]
MRKKYPTDLTDEEWRILEPLAPAIKSGGRPANYTRREILNAILYVLRSGCQWRMFPHDLPNWQTVYTYSRNWRLAGGGERIHESLSVSLSLVRQGQSIGPPKVGFKIPGGISETQRCLDADDLMIHHQVVSTAGLEGIGTLG